ncbi:MAG: response regulator [Verrucomicrobiota bacterium]
MSQPIRIALVEDDARVRDSFRQVFSRSADFELVSDFSDAESALRALPTQAPDVVLMDINLPGISGIECRRALKAVLPQLRVVMVTVYDDNDTLFQSLLAGADGYLLKRSTRDRLLESVREIVAGGASISPQMARRMVEYFHRLKELKVETVPAIPPVSPEMQTLTAREQEVLSKLAGGLVPKEVATELNISWETVRHHVSNIYAKLHVHSRGEAIIKYLGATRPPTGNP